MSGIQALLSQAIKCERDYDWLSALEFYERVFGSLPETDFLKMGQVQESIGYAFYRAAMQAKGIHEFKDTMRQAVASYEKAKEFYGKLGGKGEKSRTIRCDAMIAYVGYWLASEVPEKKRLLEECWQLAKEALRAFEQKRNSLEYGGTYNQLSLSAYLAYELEWDFQTRKRIIAEAVEYGERAITAFSSVGGSHELTRAYVKTSLYLTIFGMILISDIDERDRHCKKGLDYWRRAVELSEEVALLELLSIPPSGEAVHFLSADSIIAYYEKALGLAKKTKDKYLIGSALEWLAYANLAKAGETEVRKLELQAVQQYGEGGRHQFSVISFVSPRYLYEPNCFWILSLWETDLKKKRALLEKARVAGAEAIGLAERAGYPAIKGWAHHDLSKAFGCLAQIETNAEEKMKLLEKALEHRNKCNRIIRQLFPFNYWDQGILLNYEADLKAELSDLEKNAQKRRNMLEEAISNKDSCMHLCTKDISHERSYHLKRKLHYLAYYRYSYGEMLSHASGLLNNDDYQRKAIKAFEEAAESFLKLDQFSRVAECYWKAAQTYEVLGKHLKAAESFFLASNNYKTAAEKIPQLKDLYQDFSIYMHAWSEIEKARHHHARQEYDVAEGHFDKAADLHKSLKQWEYLALNYSAWAQVEHAEEMSRKEQSEEAIQAFKQAIRLFNEAKKSLQAKLSEIEDLDEKQMVTNTLKATSPRLQYCTARITLEEARISDKKGDHYVSSEKYGSTAEAFEKIIQELESEQEQREIKFIMNLSKAWQKMTRAEAEASPALYLEASQLFEEAKEYGPSERAKMLTLGHSRFCRALEAGTRFIDTRDATLHDAVIQRLGSASDYYVRAGFQNASEYAKATKLLFDAYVHIGDADRDTSPEKKAKLYTMAEKILQTSAGSFMKAEHPEKRKQVLKMLGKVKEERELAISLSEVLHAPTIVSSTTTFSTPTPTHESAVGLERFEHADIQAHLTIPEGATLGEEFEIRLDLVNVGKEPALLVAVEGLVPPTFKITKTPPNYSIEDHTLDLKGQRLEPQKVEFIKISAKATKTGVTTLCPQITYVDELGKFHTHKPEAVQNTILHPTEFQFKTDNAQKVFEYLTKAFVEDYMKRRLTQEKSGWRTLMQVVKAAKISKKSVYGTVTRKGSAIGELEGRGVVELRMFLGERGRGGEITKVRIAYEKDTIKRHIDQQVMKTGGK